MCRIVGADDDHSGVGKNVDGQARMLVKRDAQHERRLDDDRNRAKPGGQIGKTHTNRPGRPHLNGVAAAELHAGGVGTIPKFEQTQPATRAVVAAGVGEVERVKSQGPEVEREQPRGRIAEQNPHRERSLHRGDDADRRPEHARGVAGGKLCRRWRIAKHTPEARDARHERRRPTLTADHAAHDPRQASMNADVVQQKSRLGVVRPVNDDVHVAQQSLDVAGVEIDRVRLDVDFGIDGNDSVACGFDFGAVLSGIRFHVERLPLQVGPLDEVAIDDSKPAHACPRQRIRDAAAQRAHADDQHGGGANPRLAVRADLGQKGLTMVAVDRHRDETIYSSVDRKETIMATDTQQIIDAAEKLGKMITEHPAIVRYTDASKAVGADPEASRLFAEFQREVQSLSQQEQSGQPISASQKQRLQSLQQTIASNLKVKAFSIAQMEMTDMLRKVSEAWQRPVAEAQQAGKPAATGAGNAGGPRLVYPG
jgi:cell fate (sporulation/competence/biofilm development) regulator YlbF (YheA/YmcA/DUF963 family)